MSMKAITRMHSTVMDSLLQESNFGLPNLRSRELHSPRYSSVPRDLRHGRRNRFARPPYLREAKLRERGRHLFGYDWHSSVPG